MLQQCLEQQLLWPSPPECISNAKLFNSFHKATTYASHLFIFQPLTNQVFPTQRLSHSTSFPQVWGCHFKLTLWHLKLPLPLLLLRPLHLLCCTTVSARKSLVAIFPALGTLGMAGDVWGCQGCCS